MKFPTLALVLAVSVFAAPAWSAEHSMGHGKKMEDCKLHRTDLSDAEFAKAQDEMFVAIDADKNGSISREEFTAHHDEMRRKHREQAEKAGKDDTAHKH